MQYENDEVLFGFFVVLACTVASIVTAKLWFKNKGKSLFFYLIWWILSTCYVLFENISIVFESQEIWKISYTLLSFTFLAWMIFLDYTFSVQIGWKRFSIGLGYAILFTTWLWRPENNVVITRVGLILNYEIPFEIGFLVLTDLYFLLLGISVLYWAIKTHDVAPRKYKKHMLAFVVVSILIIVTTTLNVMLNDLNMFPDDTKSIISLLLYASFLSVAFISMIVLYKAPLIVHLLPYTVYRLMINSKDGVPYYEKKWSDDEINVTLLAGLLSAIGTMTKGTLDNINTGKIQEVKLENAVMLIVDKYSPVTVSLIASKSSRDLRDSLDNFTTSFVGEYKNILYDSNGFSSVMKGDPNDIFKKSEISAIINKHFSNVPDFTNLPSKTRSSKKSIIDDLEDTIYG